MQVWHSYAQDGLRFVFTRLGLMNFVTLVMCCKFNKAGIHQSPIETLRRLRNGVAIVAWAPQGSRPTLPGTKCFAIVRWQMVRGKMSRAHIHILTREHTHAHIHRSSTTVQFNSTFQESSLITRTKPLSLVACETPHATCTTVRSEHSCL